MSIQATCVKADDSTASDYVISINQTFVPSVAPIVGETEYIICQTWAIYA